MKLRPDGRYQTQITVIENGKKKQKYFYGKSEREIKRKILEYQKQSDKPKNVNFKELAENWKEDHYKTIEHYTQISYNAPLKNVIDHFGSENALTITPVEIQDFINALIRKNFARQTVKLRLIVMNLIFRYGIVKGILLNNPCSDIKLPKKLKKTKRPPAQSDDLVKIDNSINDPFGLYGLLVYYTGCRKSEALALEWQDIDFEKCIVKIDKAIIYVDNKPILRHNTKSEAGMREVIIPDFLVNALLKFKRKSGIIFHGSDGSHLSNSEYRKMWKIYCKNIDINITAHQLRHSYGGLLYDAGVEVKDAQELMGHASAGVTMDIYTELSKDRKTKTAQKINKYIEERNNKTNDEDQ